MCIGEGSMDESEAVNRYGTGSKAWEQLEDSRRLLVDALEADHRLAPVRSNGRSSKKKVSKCQRCFVHGEPERVPIPVDFRSCGHVSLTTWACALRALQTPHCHNCGTVTPRPCTGVLGGTRDFAQRAAAGAPLSWSVTLLPCVCCGRQLASDAIACVRCGTTSPRGGYLVQPRLQRCARCGAQVASDAGLCVSCGTSNYRPRSLFDPGPADLRLVGCPSCGREIAADAILCVHCGSAWPVANDTMVSRQQDSSSAEGGQRRQLHWITASEAVESLQHSLNEQVLSKDKVEEEILSEGPEESGVEPAGSFFVAATVSSVGKASTRAAGWDSFFDDEDDDEDDGRGVGLARRAG